MARGTLGSCSVQRQSDLCLLSASDDHPGVFPDFAVFLQRDFVVAIKCLIVITLGSR